MMGHREVMVGGEEFDAFTKWRKFLKWRPGARKAIKQRAARRMRREARRELRGEQMREVFLPYIAQRETDCGFCFSTIRAGERAYRSQSTGALYCAGCKREFDRAAQHEQGGE